MAPMSLPPGFRFHPTDEELVGYYLDKKINGRSIELDIIPEVDLYKCEPWDLPEKSFLPSNDMEWYFYSPRDKKYPNGSRTNRATRAGYWKATGKDRLVHSNKSAIGVKKTLVYYRGRAPHGVRTNWVMHEYRLLDSLCTTVTSTTLKESYALCRIFKKTIQQIPKDSSTTEIESIINNNKGDEKDNAIWASVDEQLLVGDKDNNLNYKTNILNEDNINPKFPISDTSSSEVTQGTPAESGAMVDDLQAPNVSGGITSYSDEAISGSNNFFYSLGVDFTSNLIQDIHMQYQNPYPPLELEDFPQININIGETKPSSSKNEESLHHYMMNNINSIGGGTFDDIFALCSSDNLHNNSNIIDQY